MNTIEEIQAVWKDYEDTHKLIAETMAHKVNEVPELKAHRDYVETNSFGFGERPFVWLHKLLVDEMPEEFTFMEIGVYRSAIVSLYRLLADRAGKKVIRYGVSPMSVHGNFEDFDYEKDAITIHDEFKLEKDFTIIKGLSTDPEIIARAQELSLDILYIDGGHDYKTVSSDLKYYLPLIKPGGYLVIDDCANDLDLPKNYFFGIESVTKAVYDFPLPNDEFNFIYSVGHNKLYQRVQ